MEHANTNQGSIGIMHRRNPQCWWAQKVRKGRLGGPKLTQKKNQFNRYRYEWIRRISFPSRNGTLRIHFRLIVWIDSHSERAGRKRRGPLQSYCSWQGAFRIL
jgi:hypothetical protein